MLKKLKHKFILINMLMVGLVIIFIFTAVCILTYRSEKNEIKRSLEQVISLKGKDEIHIGGAPEIGGVMPLPYVYAFSVLVDENGEITGSYKIRRPTPVEAYLKLQKRFAHLLGKKGDPETVARLQRMANRNIEKFGLTEEAEEHPEGLFRSLVSPKGDAESV